MRHQYPSVILAAEALAMSGDISPLLQYRPGDIVRLNGTLVKITKRTNYAVAYEPYTLFDRAEAWLLQKLDR